MGLLYVLYCKLQSKYNVSPKTKSHGTYQCALCYKNENRNQFIISKDYKSHLSKDTIPVLEIRPSVIITVTWINRTLRFSRNCFSCLFLFLLAHTFKPIQTGFQQLSEHCRSSKRPGEDRKGWHCHPSQFEVGRLKNAEREKSQEKKR